MKLSRGSNCIDNLLYSTVATRGCIRSYALLQSICAEGSELTPDLPPTGGLVGGGVILPK